MLASGKQYITDVKRALSNTGTKIFFEDQPSRYCSTSIPTVQHMSHPAQHLLCESTRYVILRPFAQKTVHGPVVHATCPDSDPGPDLTYTRLRGLVDAVNAYAPHLYVQFNSRQSGIDVHVLANPESHTCMTQFNLDRPLVPVPTTVARQP
jgi:hypothetical protein